jgi:triosephosphate isomerase
MRVKLIMGNWKMNGSIAMIRELLPQLKSQLTVNNSAVEYAICPPFVFLSKIGEQLEDSAIALGAQNLSEHHIGAYTGEVSAHMLREVGCHYVIVGHSERRQYHAETNEVIAKKCKQALAVGLKPVLCVGETLAEREKNQTEAVVKAQLQAVLKECSVDEFSQAVIAYEPVWAIGTGLAASAEQVQQVHQFLRQVLKEWQAKAADKVRIIYGGSVKGNNAAELLKLPDVDGALVGGASLKAEEFVTICRSA